MSTLIEDAEDVCAMEQNTVKERPILFAGPMVRAILSGHKTQTRRVIKIQPRTRADIGSYGAGRPFIRNPDSAGKNLDCPYGQPGDRLWVRETWQGPIMGGDEFENEYRDDPAKFQTPEHCFYAADGGSPPEFVDADDNLRCCWRPSIHMPRWACRIVLEIVSVRVERLNEISDDDALAEGIQYEERIIETRYEAGQHIEVTVDMYHVDGKRSDAHYSAGECFQSLWESINGPESWNANPWVWCITFRRVI